MNDLPTAWRLTNKGRFAIERANELVKEWIREDIALEDDELRERAFQMAMAEADAKYEVKQ